MEQRSARVNATEHHCKSCFKPFTGDNPRASQAPICKACLPQYESDFLRIRQYLDRNPGANKRDISNFLGIIPFTVNLYIDEDRIIYAPNQSKVVHGASAKLSPTFENRDQLISLAVSGADIVDANESVSYFVITGGEFRAPQREPIFLRDTQPGTRSRDISGYIDSDNDKLGEGVKKMLVDGNKFAVYVEHGQHIIPAELQYFRDRPVQIAMKPNQVRVKQSRAERVPVIKEITVTNMAGISAKALTHDISATGLSFTCSAIIANANDTIRVGEKNMTLVERKKYGGSYFYRGYFV